MDWYTNLSNDRDSHGVALTERVAKGTRYFHIPADLSFVRIKYGRREMSSFKFPLDGSETPYLPLIQASVGLATFRCTSRDFDGRICWQVQHSLLGTIQGIAEADGLDHLRVVERCGTASTTLYYRRESSIPHDMRPTRKERIKAQRPPRTVEKLPTGIRWRWPRALSRVVEEPPITPLASFGLPEPKCRVCKLVRSLGGKQ